MIAGRKKPYRFMVKVLKRALPRSFYVTLRDTSGKIVERTRRALPSSKHKGCVSIVVPVYNVETYVKACLDSILMQTYPKIEIIAVIDGSTDSSEAIVRQIAAQDSRVHVLWQENAGLSAARNVGAAAATGEYLWFVDSDDVIEPTAVQKMVGALKDSKSEFVVCSYYRFSLTRRWDPGTWILQAHATDQKGITLQEFPEILVSAVACNKLFKRSYWTRMSLSFPVGQIYEDQEVSALAYVKANAFSILHEQLYGWRDREDHSSISQQTQDINDMNGRMRAIRTSIATLQRAGAPVAAEARRFQFLNHDFQHSARRLVGVSDAYWASFRDQVIDITRTMSLDDWSLVESRFAVLEWLVIHDHRQEAEQYLIHEGLDQSRYLVGWRNGRLISHVPYWNDDALAIPDQVLEILPSEIEIKHSIRRVRWDADNEILVISGWAYLSGFLASDIDSTFSAFLVRKETRIPLEVRRYEDSRIDDWDNSALIEHSYGAFDILVYLDALPAEPLPANYEIELSIANHGLARTTLVCQANLWSSVYLASCATSRTDTRVRLSFPDQQPIRLRVEHPEFLLHDVKIQRDRIEGAIRVNRRTLELPQTLAIYSMDTPQDVLVSALITKRENAEWCFKLPVADLDWASKGLLLARIVTVSGERYPIDWPDAGDQLPRLIPGTELAVFRNRVGNFALFVPDKGSVRVDTLDAQETRIKLTGELIRGQAPTYICLSGPEVHQAIPIVWEGNRWNAEIPLTVSQWGQDAYPLPLGRYSLLPPSIDTGSKHTEQLSVLSEKYVSKFHFNHSIQADLPLYRGFDSIRYQAELSPQGFMEMTVVPPLRVNERGKYHQAQLQQRRNSHGNKLRGNAVVLRSYYGEWASCNPYGIHRAIVNSGCDMKILWGVTDHSVDVPKPGIPVVIGSGEWYEALETSKYAIFNVHQPDYHHHIAGQIIVQTLHGYPFKLSGVPYWKANGVSAARLASFMRRQDEWDYLVSPAPYATPLLHETFPFGGRMLEIGYPRNDIFFDSQAESIRDRVRRTLGIPKDVKAILYAPTYRDYLASSEFKAQAVHFLNEIELADMLGEEYVLLMRGHMMNARAGNAYSTKGRVIDVTSYPRIEDLCLASDAGVMDYSSLRFDYALTGKPMVFFTPDKDLYLEKSRGSLIPYGPTAPGPQTGSVEELAAFITDLDDVAEMCRADRERFSSEFSVWEDGHAGERLVKEVFAQS